MTGPEAEAVEAGRAALRRGDAVEARAHFATVTTEPSPGALLEGMARADFLDRDFRSASQRWEQAYAAYRTEGDAVGAIRVARSLACIHGTIFGDWAVGGGWSSRAQTLLREHPDDQQRGWVALNLGMFDGDRSRREACFTEALHLARIVGDTDLEFVALAYHGANLVHDDRIEEGMSHLDEALAAVAGSDVDDFICLEEIFCQLFAACEYAHDVHRADQWMRVGADIADRRSLPSVSAFCHTHYGGVLTAAGRWPEADEALTEAIRLWGLGQRSALRIGALIRLADLRVRQGRLEEAEQLLADESVQAFREAARPLAATRLARGELDRARDTLTAALRDFEPTSVAAAPLLALLIDVELAAGRADAADAAAELLEACAERHREHLHVRAAAALARGRVCLATGDGDPLACLREAVSGFSRAALPMELATTRLELAAALAAQRPDDALAEARTALDAFERLAAARSADAASALLRSLGVRVPPSRGTDSVITKREAEVLDLLGHGLSNPEIADRLYISRKTVEHHVGNILAKLGLRSRAEAAAHAARREPGRE